MCELISAPYSGATSACMASYHFTLLGAINSSEWRRNHDHTLDQDLHQNVLTYLTPICVRAHFTMAWRRLAAVLPEPSGAGIIAAPPYNAAFVLGPTSPSTCNSKQ